MPIHFHIVYDYFYTIIEELLQQRLYGLQSLKYLSSGP